MRIYRYYGYYSYYSYFLLLCLFSLVLNTGTNVMAVVDPRNGNLYLHFDDIVAPGAEQNLEIQRAYNSTSWRIGWFGIGWGCYYETQLIVAADGSLFVIEHGNGSTTRYMPDQAGFNAENAAALVVKKIKEKGTGTVSPDAEQKLLERLRGDVQLRQIYAESLNISANVPVGSKFSTINKGSSERIERTTRGFERRFPNGRVEIFSDKGKLITVLRPNGYRVDIVYDGDVVKQIKDSESKSLVFEWFSDKRVKNITLGGNKKATYQYENIRLVKSTNALGVTLEYKYTPESRIKTVLYPNKISEEYTYTAPMLLVASYKDANNVLINFKYDRDPKNPNSSTTTSTYQDAFGKPVISKYEYEVKKNSDGEETLIRHAVTTLGVKNEVIYDEKTKLPIEVTKGGVKEKMTYTADGLLKEKRYQNGDFLRYEYHSQHKKISKFEDKSGWAKYDYDSKGNLTKASTSVGHDITVLYNSKGLISKVVDNNLLSKAHRVLELENNIMGKPSKVTVEGVGTIMIEYDNLGAFKEVQYDKKNGERIFKHVRAIVNDFTTAVSPAGVSLGIAL
ncbi:MAG: RHS repeat protein [Oligoflexia bacterium]|nr:RHS repeat protein [Oligoflexia bacterium]